MRVIFSILIFTALLSGCVSFPLKTENLEAISLKGSKNGSASVSLKTGNVISGSAPVMMAVGGTYVPGPSTGHPGWGYSKNDQEVFVRHLANELSRNNIFNTVSYGNNNKSDYAIEIAFNNTVQQSDWAVYYLDVSMLIMKDENEVLNKNYQFQANDKSEEFWKNDSWSGAKARASNRLAKKMISDLQQWLTN